MQEILIARLRNLTADAIGAALYILLILALGVLAYSALSVVTRRLERVVVQTGDNMVEERQQYAATVSGIVRSTGLVIIVAAVGIMILDKIGVNIAPILAGAGIVGLAIGFGAQTLVKDVISGLFILMERQFSVGDLVEVGSVAGSVEKMTLRSTILRDSEGARHILPNGEIRVVSNRSAGWSQAVLDIGIGYGDSIDHAIRALETVGEELQAAPAFRELLLDRPAVVGVQELGDSAVVLRMTARTRPGQHLAVSRELRRRVKEKFDAAGIDMPYPTQVHLTRVIIENGAPTALTG